MQVPQQQIQAVVFDAVGTLIYPEPSVADAYRAALAEHCGIEIDSAAIKAAFKTAMKSRTHGDSLATSEEDEKSFWADLIRRFCGDNAGFQNCFDSLFRHFAMAKHWRCFPGTQETITELRDNGFQVAIASNFDRRLDEVCDGLPEVSHVTERIISSVVGWRKPATEFFQAVARQLKLSPNQILMVGDDLTNDVSGALRAGMQAVHLSHGQPTSCPPGVVQVSSLPELLAKLHLSTKVTGRANH